MNTHQKENVVSKRLPLSHLIYRDEAIDAKKADNLIVYHYPLSKSYKWKEWEQQLDDQLSDPKRFYPYLMKSYRGEFGLFVALNDASEMPPKILNGDGIKVIPQRVRYAQELNPVWVRLIMRKARAFGAHCQGSHTLGRPLLQVDTWSGKNKSGGGINAISLDCRTQQLKNGDATEVVLFHENVPLREVRQSDLNAGWQGSLWKYSRNKVLMRWFPEHDQKNSGTIYREIKKNKHQRKQRVFLDVNSAQAFEKSWPYILKPVQEAFIEEAAKFGFILKPKVLNLRPMPLKTKYPTKADKTSFSSLQPGGTIDVIDLRVATSVTGGEVVAQLQELLDSKKLGVKLQLHAPVKPEKINDLNFNRQQRVLVLLDQTPGIVDDRYPLTSELRHRVACQHINVNPNDLASDSVEQGLLVEFDGELVLPSDSKYYDYPLEQCKKDKNKKALMRNLEVAIKELELKRLLLNPDAKISEVLKKQSGFLTEKLVVITDGYLFTVKSDRPVLIPFNPSNPERVKLCDSVLNHFNLSTAFLLESLLKEKWPYNYKPEVVMQGFGSPDEKLTRFARRLTFVIAEENDGVSVMFQDPKYETPHMLPEGLVETKDILRQQKRQYALKNWLLPDTHAMEQTLKELENEEIINKASAVKLRKELPKLMTFWQESLRELVSGGVVECIYRELKGLMFDQWKLEKYPDLDEKERKKKKVDPNLISVWDELLSNVLQLPLKDVKGWVRGIPGITRLWYDQEQDYFVIGGLTSPKNTITRQPSIRQWHSMQGPFNPKLITDLVDVDWVRMNQLAGNPCVATLIRRWRECQQKPEQALSVELLT